MSERWMPVRNFEDRYLVSDQGNVFSLNRQRKLRPCVGVDGYERVGLAFKGKVKTKRVHILVAEAFIDGEGAIVHHIDGDVRNNVSKNLQYVSAAEHIKLHPGKRGGSTRFRAGNAYQFGRGENHPFAKFKNGEVFLIKWLYRAGVARSMIAKMFKVNPRRIDCIIYGYAWGCIQDPPFGHQSNQKKGEVKNP